MYKIINIDPYFNDTDEPSLKLIDVNDFSKTAAVLGSHIPEEIESFIKGIKPDPRYAYVHAIAVSADEWYGVNRNGDAFPEKDLLAEQDDEEAIRNSEPFKGKKIQRYKTFLSAKLYKHHINKDPEKSYGHVACAAYNMQMHRVELIICIDRDKDPEFVQDLENGVTVPLSMGCKVPFDICSICGNKAKRREDYCVHAKLMMNQILPDGRQVKVYNTKPRFFDISKVLVPADEQAYTLKKVAGMNIVDYDPREYYEKESSLKVGEIKKEIPGTAIGDAVKNVNDRLLNQVKNTSCNEPDISDDDVSAITEHPLRDILSTITNMGMVLKPEEHRKIIIIRIRKNPDMMKESSSIDIDFKNPSIYNILKKYAEKRSCYTDHLIKRAALSQGTVREVETDEMSDLLYKSYRDQINSLDIDKLAAVIDRTYNLDGLFKGAAHWALPAAGIPLAAAYMYGAHQDYKRRFEGRPLSEFQSAMAEKPGKAGLAGSGAGLGLGYLAKHYKLKRV